MKYVLLPLPGAILLPLVGLGEAKGRWRSTEASLLWLSCVIGGATGVAVAFSDYRWANSYRDFIEEEFRDFTPTNRRTLHNTQWGLHYYAERVGIERYLGETLSADDELLVSKMIPRNWDLDRRLRVAVRRWEVGYSGPFAILSFELKAGFYSNRGSVYPFAPARRVTDTSCYCATNKPTLKHRHCASTRRHLVRFVPANLNRSSQAG